MGKKSNSVQKKQVDAGRNRSLQYIGACQN